MIILVDKKIQSIHLDLKHHRWTTEKTATIIQTWMKTVSCDFIWTNIKMFKVLKMSKN